MAFSAIVLITNTLDILANELYVITDHILDNYYYDTIMQPQIQVKIEELEIEELEIELLKIEQLKIEQIKKEQLKKEEIEKIKKILQIREEEREEPAKTAAVILVGVLILITIKMIINGKR